MSIRHRYPQTPMTMAEIGAAYDARALEYIDLFGTIDQMPETDRDAITRWRDTTSGRLLDAGCGPGHWSAHLSQDGLRDVVGVDASADFVAAARERFPELSFSRADLASLPLEDDSVGGILAWYSLIHTPPAGLPAILKELVRVLAPGGSILIGFFDGEPGEPFDHAVHTGYRWTPDALGGLLAPHGLTVKSSSTRQDPGARRRHGDLLASR